MPDAQRLARQMQGAGYVAATTAARAQVEEGLAWQKDGQKTRIGNLRAHTISNITPQTPLTYVRMVLRQHATIKLQHTLPHRKRFLVPSEFGV